MKDKKRQSNVELLRILLMLLVISHHYVANGGLVAQIAENPLSRRSVFFALFGGFGKVGINTFVLITGYFMCRQTYRTRKILRLVSEVLFYRLAFYFIFVRMGYIQLNAGSFISEVIDISSLNYNFTGSYLVFFLLIPYLNMIAANSDRRALRNLLSICFLAFSIIAALPVFNEWIPNTFTGAPIMYVPWFCVVYLLGTYLRLYEVIRKNALATGVLLVLATAMSILAGCWLTDVTETNYVWFFVSECNKPFAVLGAVGLYMIFLNLAIGSIGFINYISRSTFGILLIHSCNSGMRSFLWEDLCKCADADAHLHYATDAVVAVILIYIVCFAIDSIRSETIGRWFDKQIMNG